MKKAIALTAIAGLATVASAQSILFAVDGTILAPGTEIEPVDGQTYQIDVVLDATAYGGSFFAWHQYNFNVDVAGAFNSGGVSGDTGETDPNASAATPSSPAFGGPWTGGRRPGRFPGAGATNGGSRFGTGLADIVDGTGLSSTVGTIGGRQAALPTPENNANIHDGRVYEAFRFSYTWAEADGRLDFSLSSVVLNVYPDNITADNTFVNAAEIGSFSFVPAPASVALLGLGGLAAARRRRA